MPGISNPITASPTFTGTPSDLCYCVTPPAQPGGFPDMLLSAKSDQICTLLSGAYERYGCRQEAGDKQLAAELDKFKLRLQGARGVESASAHTRSAVRGAHTDRQNGYWGVMHAASPAASKAGSRMNAASGAIPHVRSAEGVFGGIEAAAERLDDAPFLASRDGLKNALRATLRNIGFNGRAAAASRADASSARLIVNTDPQEASGVARTHRARRARFSLHDRQVQAAREVESSVDAMERHPRRNHDRLNVDLNKLAFSKLSRQWHDQPNFLVLDLVHRSSQATHSVVLYVDDPHRLAAFGALTVRLGGSQDPVGELTQRAFTRFLHDERHGVAVIDLGTPDVITSFESAADRRETAIAMRHALVKADFFPPNKRHSYHVKVWEPKLPG